MMATTTCFDKYLVRRQCNTKFLAHELGAAIEAYCTNCVMELLRIRAALQNKIHSASSTVRYHADTREDPYPSGKARGRIPRQYCYSLDIQDVYHGRGASGSDACPDEQAWHARECLSLSWGLAPKHSPIRPRRNSTGTRSIQPQTRCEGNPTFTLG